MADRYTAWLVNEPDNGGEDVVSYPIDGQQYTLVSSDRETIENWRPQVVELADRTGRSFRLVELIVSAELEQIKPADDGHE